MNSSLAKSAGILGSLTALSRVLGFVRDLIIATAFGTGVAAEAFVVSFKIPNLLRDLVGEGAMNSAFVPVLTECHEKRKEEFWHLVSTLFFMMTAILILLSVLGCVFAPQIVRLIAPGFVLSTDPEKFPLTVKLTRVIFPYLFFIGLSALAMGVLNSLKEFGSSALGPVFLNISMIVAGFFYEKHYGPMALVVGVLAGGVLQLGCQIGPLLKRGFRLTPPRWNHDSVKRIGRLLLPRVFGSALYQINVFVDSVLASFETIIGPGGQSALYYSNRLFQLPLAIFGYSIAQAALPTFSSQMVLKDLEGFKSTFSAAVRSLALVVLPASAGLITLCGPIVRIIFEHGRFNAYSTQITQSALYFYAFGLLSCCLIKLLVNAFYAMQDTRTPVKTMLMAVVLNVILSLLMMRPLKIGGLALASTLSATVNVVMLYVFLRKRVGAIDERRILKSIFKISTAAAVMGFFSFSFNHWVLEAHRGAPTTLQAFYLFLGISLSVLVYLGSVWVLKVEAPPFQSGRSFFKKGVK
ncbi:MAG: murein biosynthesis integral membrane protein MurJ [Omnitrophica bacterium RIFCSPHIGHO2_02_FULL_51_18]|nr:MAG: murein biosynthesis integral membrane protein MurJ [Omnitrophica bacterium RIFCSPHIGHO2_02_FULL_51_18]